MRERKLQEEMALQQEKLANGQEEFRHACERALEARVRRGRGAAAGKCLANRPVLQQIIVLPFSRKYRMITVIFTLRLPATKSALSMVTDVSQASLWLCVPCSGSK